jgi:membrane protease YdiL (CAAX protease family)
VTETPASIRKEIKTFLGLTIVISAVAYVPLVASYRVGGTFALGAMMALVWAPGIAALATRYHYHEEIYGMGWGWGENRFQAIAFLLPLAYGIVAYGGIWLTGYATLEGSLFGAIFSLDYLHFLFVFMLSRVFLAAGEEIGWRGFLVPELAKVTSFIWVGIISGLMWATWHLAPILLANYDQGAPLWYTIAMFYGTVVLASIPMAWLRLKSGSLWTAVLWHSANNYFVQAFFDKMTVDTGITHYLRGEFGIITVISIGILAVIFYNRRNELA